MKKPSEEAIYEKSEYFYSDERMQIVFRDGAKWAISQMEQDDVIEKVNPICPYCGKYKTTQGNGILHQLCECGNTDIPSLYVIEKVKELRSLYEAMVGVYYRTHIDKITITDKVVKGVKEKFIEQLNAIIEKP